MTQNYLIEEGSAILAKQFRRPLVYLQLDLSHPTNWYRNVKKSRDMTLDWEILDSDNLIIYKGVALLRDGEVHYYDRTPLFSPPLRITSLKTNSLFEKRARLVSQNIEKILNS